MTVNNTEAIRQNLEKMDDLDFTAWNTPDWDLFRHLHAADVHVEVSGQGDTDGIDAHVDALEQTGGQPMQVQSHPISFGSGDWTCAVGEFESGASMVTVARWRDGAIAEEYVWRSVGPPPERSSSDGGLSWSAAAADEQPFLRSRRVCCVRRWRAHQS